MAHAIPRPCLGGVWESSEPLRLCQESHRENLMVGHTGATAACGIIQLPLQSPLCEGRWPQLPSSTRGGNMELGPAEAVCPPPSWLWHLLGGLTTCRTWQDRVPCPGRAACIPLPLSALTLLHWFQKKTPEKCVRLPELLPPLPGQMPKIAVEHCLNYSPKWDWLEPVQHVCSNGWFYCLSLNCFGMCFVYSNNWSCFVTSELVAAGRSKL